MPPNFRDRIRDFRRVPAKTLRHNPKNWRTHPPEQREALDGILAEVGIAGAVLAREMPDGTLELIDGHLRAETLDQDVPVLVLDVTEREADMLLATLDPLAGMAGADAAQLSALLASVDTSSEAINAMLADLAESAGPIATNSTTPKEKQIPELLQIVAECKSVAEQEMVFGLLKERGIKCRVLTL